MSYVSICYVYFGWLTHKKCERHMVIIICFKIFNCWLWKKGVGFIRSSYMYTNIHIRFKSYEKKIMNGKWSYKCHSDVNKGGCVHILKVWRHRLELIFLLYFKFKSNHTYNSIMHWIKNLLRRMSEHNHRYNYLHF